MMKRFLWWWRRKQEALELEEELKAHLAIEAHEQHQPYANPEEAGRAARKALGNVTRITEDVQDVWRFVWLDDLFLDFRFGARTLRRNPGFTLVVILTLSIGIGATVAVFSILDAALLRPLPYKDPDRLVAIWGRGTQDKSLSKIFLDYDDFESFGTKGNAFESVAAGTWAGSAGSHVLSGRGPAKQVIGIPVSASFFPTLGVPPALGRTFTADDQRQGCAVVLAHGFWTSTFAADPGVVGQSITLDQKACSVLGVMPAKFAFFPSRTDAWILLEREVGKFGVGVFARLKPGVTLAQAEAEAARLHREQHPTGMWKDITPEVYDLHGEFAFLASRTLRTTLILMFAAVLLVLSIACLNVANLFLARLDDRERELAVRAAMGSGRARLARQVLAEALLLSLAGTITGVVLASAAIRYFQSASPIELTAGSDVTINFRVLLFAVALSSVTTLVFGWLPSLRASRGNLITRLRRSGRGSVANNSGTGMTKAGIAFQIALSFVLLIGATLLLNSALRMGQADLGFNPTKLYATYVSLPASRYATNEQRLAFYERLEDRIRGLQGVAGVALASKLPPDAGGNQEIEIQSQPSEPGSRPHDVGADAVTPGFFELLQIPLTKGRQFDSRDHPDSAAVTIVNEALAAEYFRGRNPIGQQVRIADASDNHTPWLTIVGVVGNLKHSELMNEMRWAETPILYRPLLQEPRPAIGIAFKTFTTALSHRDIEYAVNSLDVEVPVAEMETLSTRVSKLMAYPNFRAVVLSFFATSALLLSAVGLHGVLMQIVARRTPEFAIRRSVGAQANDVIQLVLRQAGLPVLAGLCAGFVCTFAFSRVISNLLYGIEPADLIALVLVTVTLLVAAGGAIALPAIRAVRIDPMIALRQD